MKTTLDLPDALVKQVKLRALQEGQKLKDTVASLLRKGLAAPKESSKSSPPAMKNHKKTGLPYIDCPRDAPARRMTTSELIAMEQLTQTQEDLERLRISSR